MGSRPSFGASSIAVTLLSKSRYAKARGVSVRTVERWLAAGKIAPASRTEGGHMRFAFDDTPPPAVAPAPPATEADKRRAAYQWVRRKLQVRALRQIKAPKRD